MTTTQPREAAVLPVTMADVEAAASRIENVAMRTPVSTSRTLNERLEGEVVFKCENLQRAGAFKIRGAYNAISQLSQDQRSRGVLTFSSGNHAQGVALACQYLKTPATIFMPKDAPRVKLQATREYGAEIVQYDRSEEERQELGGRLAEERGLTIIPPYDNPHIVAGQGTCVREFVDDVGPLDVLVVPVGGGGLISGCAIAMKALAPTCKVIGVEPEAGDDAVRSFKTGTLQRVDNPDTIADGARTNTIGELNFQIIRELVDDMITVPDAALVKAMWFFLERMKLLVEPTGCLAAAAVMEGLVEARGRRVGVVLSGGNVDVRQLGELFTRFLPTV